jgi:2-C-methyl-D-erythritol 2,4-cyclodiphosphate synthase
MRVGFGYDSHRLAAGRRFVLGGVEIPHDKGLEGHSDADVLAHAVCDAILGAMAAGDIGRHFPDTDPLYRDISSLRLLERVRMIGEEKGFLIHNIDATVILEKPRLSGYMDRMCLNIAGALNIAADHVSVKAKTNEGMGFTGRLEGVAAHAVATVRRKEEA